MVWDIIGKVIVSILVIPIAAFLVVGLLMLIRADRSEVLFAVGTGVLIVMSWRLIW